jgi:hypothetical protein
MPQTLARSKSLALLAIAGLLHAQEAQPSSKYYAMRVGGDGTNWVEAIGSELHAKVFQDDMAKRYRIVLLERPESISPSVFNASIKKIERRYQGVTSVQVYASAKGLSIPTGQIIVVFKDGTSAADARDKLTGFGVKIVGEPTRLLPEQFVVEVKDGSNAAALAAKLAQDVKVRFAEPDFVQISMPPAK